VLLLVAQAAAARCCLAWFDTIASRNRWLPADLLACGAFCCRTGEEARQHLITCSEQFLEQQPEGYSGGSIDVAAARGEAGAAASTAASSRSSSGRSSGEAADADVRLRPAAAAGAQLSRADSSKPAVDRSQTGLAAAKPGASRWGSSYWTQARAACMCHP
jgi:hypothetical protein